MHMIQIKFGYMSFPPKGHMEKKATYMCLGLLHLLFFSSFEQGAQVYRHKHMYTIKVLYRNSKEW